MKKVIYINIEPLTKQISQNLFVNELLQNGFEVEYWDMSSLYSHNFTATDPVISNVIVRITHKNEIKKRIICQDLGETIFIPMVLYAWNILWLYRLFEKYKCHTAFFRRGALPFPKQINGVNRIIKRLMAGEVTNLLKGFLNRGTLFLSSKRDTKKYDVVFAAGKQAFKLHKEESEIIEVNYFDYDHFLALKDNKIRIMDGRYAVFLDINMPFHPAWNMLNMRMITPDEYFTGMNNFFDLVEKKWNLQVIIAAHPTSNYKNSVYHGRKILKYKTNELVKDCEFVLSHISTSMSYAVLYEKPVIFLSNNAIKVRGPDWLSPFIENLSIVVGGSFYNVDEIQSGNQIEMPVVDINKYEQYKYDYLTSLNSENRFTRDILLDYLRPA